MTGHFNSITVRSDRIIIPGNAFKSLRFHDDAANFILKLALHVQFIDQKITFAKVQLEGVLAGHAELANFRSEIDRMHSILLETRMNSSKGYAVINDFCSVLLPFFEGASVSTDDKLIEFGAYLERLNACIEETRRIEREFHTLCRNMGSCHLGILDVVEEMNKDDQVKIEKAQRKLEDANKQISRIESGMRCTLSTLIYQSAGDLVPVVPLVISALYSYIYGKLYPLLQSAGNYWDRPPAPSLSSSGSGGSVRRGNGPHTSSARRARSEDSATLGHWQEQPAPPPYSERPPLLNDETMRLLDDAIGRGHIRYYDLPEQQVMQSNIRGHDDLTNTQSKYSTRIEELKARIASRMKVADTVGDLPQEIRRVASDIISFIDIYPRLKSRFEQLREAIAGGAATSAELRDKIAELTLSLPSLERGLRAYAVARSGEDVRQQMEC